MLYMAIGIKGNDGFTENFLEDQLYDMPHLLHFLVSRMRLVLLFMEFKAFLLLKYLHFLNFLRNL